MISPSDEEQQVEHDLNNQLSVIVGQAEIIASELPADHPLAAHVAEISHAAAQASSLARRLVELSHTGDLPARPLNDAVLRVRDMLRSQLSDDIEIVYSLGHDAADVQADPGIIERIVVNLAVNAGEAMPYGGTLTIETSLLRVCDEFAALSFSIPVGDYMQLAVSDTGLGMSPEVRARVFEPFFTTKNGARHTGLGLSTMYALVHRSGGFMTVHSAPGLGTTFRILLPALGKTLAAKKPEGTEAASPGTETILLVEDETGIRTSVARILVAHGYTVLKAADPVRALQFARRDGPIHLMLSDFLLPGLSGAELAVQVQALRPSLLVLLMSGYTKLEGRRGEKSFPFIQKPFTPAELLAKIRSVLDAVSSISQP